MIFLKGRGDLFGYRLPLTHGVLRLRRERKSYGKQAHNQDANDPGLNRH